MKPAIQSAKTALSLLALVALGAGCESGARTPAAQGQQDSLIEDSTHLDVRLGTPVISGSGCPVGEATAVLSPDQLELSVIFDSYSATAQAGSPTGLAECRIQIPMTLPPSVSVSVFGADIRGFNALPLGASSSFSLEYILCSGISCHSQGAVSQQFSGPLNEEFLFRNENSTLVSACGGNVTLGIDTRAEVHNEAFEEAFITIDSADLTSGGVRYRLSYRSCS